MHRTGYPLVDLGGARPSSVADQYIHEVRKREQGRVACLQAGCSHFMSMDTDEFYEAKQLRHILQTMLKGGPDGQYQAALCKMRYYCKSARYELLPLDEGNFVSAIFVCNRLMPFRLACPYPVLVDPTRRIDRLTRVKIFDRSECEMHHMSLVRRDIGRKFRNVSNRVNYMSDKEVHEVMRGRRRGGTGTTSSVERFLRQYKTWKAGEVLVHPHPYFHEVFKSVVVVPDRFHVGRVTIDAEDEERTVEEEGAEYLLKTGTRLR